MKTYFMLILIIIIISFNSAEQETLINKPIESNGFIGPAVKLTQTKDQISGFVGFRGGWIINHTIVLGAGGYWQIDDIKIESDSIDDPSIWYGGPEFGYIFSSNKLIHFTINTLIGWGQVRYHYHDNNHYYEHNYHHNHDHMGGMHSPLFIAIEPEANIVLNITEYFRLGLGAGYRYINGVKEEGLDDTMLKGVSANLILKFGAF
jgi:hypothetical protein